MKTAFSCKHPDQILPCLDGCILLIVNFSHVLQERAAKGAGGADLRCRASRRRAVGEALERGVGASILISLQVFVGSAIVIYLDEALRKGYGLLSGIPLCTTANVW